jgi:hypothetical protein
MASNEEKLSPLEDGLLRAMSAIDNQIAREMQRYPEQVERQGVQKWEPHGKRVELISSFLMNCLGDQKINMDSLLVLAQASAKALSLVIADLGSDGLGKVRSDYCRVAMEAISSDSRRAVQSLQEELHLI